MRKNIFIITALLFGMLFTQKAEAHCEIPCGIYNDQLRVKLLYEHFTTIEKSINEINTLTDQGDKNYNQLVRWITNKEDHAIKVQHIVEQYFMHQRIKSREKGEDGYDTYIRQITLAHKLTVYAMKAKQTTDLKYVRLLRETLDKFVNAYFSEEDRKHLEGHHE